MNIPIHRPRLKGFHHPHAIISDAVRDCHRLPLSTDDVADMLAAWAMVVSRDAIRLSVKRFGRRFADCNRRVRPRKFDIWHTPSPTYRHARNDAFGVWADYTAEMAA